MHCRDHFGDLIRAHARKKGNSERAAAYRNTMQDPNSPEGLRLIRSGEVEIETYRVVTT